MIDLDGLAARAIASPVGAAPSMDRIRARQQRRARRVRNGRVGLAAVIVVATAGALYAATRSHSPTVRVVTPAQEQTSQPSTPDGGASTSVSRPVLDDCTATYATEARVQGSPFTSPRAPAEVLADPSRGATGPLAAVLRTPGTGTPQVPNGNIGGLVANGDVNGREANFQMTGGLRGGASWDLADGGNALVYTRGLTLEELRALVSQIDAGTSAFPQGLQSVGMTDSARIARSMCIDHTGLIAQITEVTGSLASRYAEMLSTAEGSNTFDTAESSIAIEPFPEKFGPDDTKYHQATPEEWARLLNATQRAEIPSDTAPGRTAPTTRAP
jgi:hypothetical protein